MTSFLKYFVGLCLAFSLAACGDTKNNKLIVGHWQGAEWLTNGHPGTHTAQAASFDFDAKDNYSFTYDGKAEKGTYKVENDMLFTTAAGQPEIMVRITKLNNDSLQFEMSNLGTPETLTLIRSNK